MTSARAISRRTVLCLVLDKGRRSGPIIGAQSGRVANIVAKRLGGDKSAMMSRSDNKKAKRSYILKLQKGRDVGLCSSALEPETVNVNFELGKEVVCQRIFGLQSIQSRQIELQR